MESGQRPRCCTQVDVRGSGKVITVRSLFRKPPLGGSSSFGLDSRLCNAHRPLNRARIRVTAVQTPGLEKGTYVNDL